PAHSWNSNQLVTNIFLYQLQRHSDHHAHPTRRYQALRHFEESPQLPSGYASMIVLALVPPLWRGVMDWRVSAHYAGNLALANMHPSRHVRAVAWRAPRGSLLLRRVRPRLRRDNGASARGLPARHAMGPDPRWVGLSRLRGARQGRLRAARRLIRRELPRRP